MVHTFELSRMLKQKEFEDVLENLKGLRYFNQSLWLTTAYNDQGISIIRLYKFKQKKKKKRKKEEEMVEVKKEDIPYHYMITLSINPNLMLGDNGYRATNILTFTPDFTRAIYDKIFDLIPQLDKYALRKKKFYDLFVKTKDIRFFNMYKSLYDDSFKIRRIDFTFDLSTMPKQYMALIERGYSIRKQSFERCYYEDEEVLEELEEEDGELDEALDENEYNTDTRYVYYKSKSLNINIYLKGEQLKKDNLIDKDNTDYDFIRIEIQVKKGKLNAIRSKFDIPKRELYYMATPEVEEYVLKSYLKALTGTGNYITYQKAMEVIDNSNFGTAKKNKLKKVIKAVKDKHGIAKVLEQVESGDITDLGKLSAVKKYLRDIHSLGINPVTLSVRMNIPKQEIREVCSNKVVAKVSVLPNLVTMVDVYCRQIAKERENGIELTEEDIEQISKL